MRAAGMGTTPEVILQKLEEEAKVNAYIVNEKLPRELQQRKQAVESVEAVLNQPAMTQADLGELKRKLKEVRQAVAAASATAKRLRVSRRLKLAPRQSPPRSWHRPTSMTMLSSEQGLWCLLTLHTKDPKR